MSHSEGRSLPPAFHRCVLVAAVAVAAALAGCADNSEKAATPEASSTALPTLPTLPTLVTHPKPVPLGGAAVVAGVLGVNAKNCITIDGTLLVAPHGSKVVDSRTVELAGLGRYVRGQTARGGGGWNDGEGQETPSWIAPCIPSGETGWAAISPDRSTDR